jgi:peptidoglycan/LPS O-acetylase OafA/YrhL
VPSAPPSGLPAPRCPRYRSLDLWRGVACLLVLVHHSTFYDADKYGSGGLLDDTGRWISVVGARLWLGVPLFFVISGYCIAATADSTRRRPHRMGTYFLRRIRRIYPPYWVLLLVTVAVVVVFDCLIWPHLLSNGGPFLRPWWLSGWQWLGNLSLTEIWRPHIGGGPRGLYLGHAWTLCYEEQFYVVMGLLLIAAPRRLFGTAAAVTLLTVLTAAAARWSGVSVKGFFFDGAWVLFALGILVYWRVNYAGKRQAWVVNAVLLLGLAYAALEPQRLLEPEKNFQQELFVAFAFALLLSLLHSWDGPMAAAPILRPLMFCGTLCYSLYLVHLPVTRMAAAVFLRLGIDGQSLSPLFTIPLCSTASILAAWAFHRAVERRFLNAPQG